MNTHMRTALLAWWLSPLAALAAADTGTVVTAPGVSLHYEKYGTGPTTTLIPGRLFLARDFAALAKPERTLIFYDMRNRGASSHVADGAKLNIIEDVNDLEALRAHFKLEKFDLVGYSYLGLMTAQYAATHPQRVGRLVQLGPVPRQFPGDYPPEERYDQRQPSQDERAAEAAYHQARSAGADQRTLCPLQYRYWAYSLVVDPANAARVPDNCEHENEWPANFDAHLGHHFADIQKRQFPVAPFGRLTLPVLVIHGRLDVNAPYGAGCEWARTFPNARLVTVDRGAHNAWLDDAAVIRDIDRFLGGEWPARAQAVAR
jgi:pimeloyl-ACP methyl ester carboxylesterase